MSGSIINMRQVSKKFDQLEVLRDINLTINKGDIYGLVGASGAGKSTLLRCINGLTDYTRGSLTVKGTDLKSLDKSNLREARRNIGMIFQQFSLMERKTVFENVALPLECWGYEKDYIKDRVHELLNLINLEDKAKSKPRELSGGQKQRIAIARALALNPDILLCDEATSALDPNTAKSILNLLQKINKELQITIIVVTHQMEVVQQICNKMALLKNGELVISGDTIEVFMKDHPALRELLGENIDKKYASTGINYRICIRPDTSQNTILSIISKQNNIPFKFGWADTNFFRDQQISFITINIEEKHSNTLEKILNEQEIEWSVI